MNLDVDFQFEDAVTPEILEELSRGFDEVRHDYDQDRRLPPHRVQFYRNGKGIVEIIGQMLDLTEQLEIGVLRFRAAEKATELIHRTVLDPSFERNLLVSKLAIEEAGMSYGSGIEFTTDSGLKLGVYAGSLPYSLAVSIPGVVADSLFTPEYYLERYIPLPM